MGTLEPRYRRVLSFADVLDESIRLFRQHWATFLQVSAVALIPSGLLDLWVGASGSFANPMTLDDLLNGRQASTGETDVGASIEWAVVSAVSFCIWSAAVVATTEVYLRGGEPNVVRIFRRALRRFVTVLLGTLVYVLRLSGLTAIGSTLLFLAVFPGLLGIVPGVGLLVWWLRPAARSKWLKWVIILCTPFGLGLYFSVRWSMFVAAAVLERRGPFAALRRSSELSTGQMFRVLSILTVSSVIVGVLVYAPIVVIAMLMTIATGLVDYGSATEAILTEAVRVVLRMLFQSLGAIIYTVMFIDLRNRREGTDMAERLTQLEASPILLRSQ